MAQVAEPNPYDADPTFSKCFEKLVQLGESSADLLQALASQGFGRSEILSAPHQGLLAEGFVNGHALTSTGLARFSYRSAIAEAALGEAGLIRDQLRDLSRSSSIDDVVASKKWAAAFTRAELLRELEPQSRQHMERPDSSELAFQCLRGDVIAGAIPMYRHEGVWIGVLHETADLGFLAVMTMKSKEFPIILRPYVLPYFGMSSEEVELSRLDKRCFHPLWILAPGTGRYLVSRDSDLLADSLVAFAALFLAASTVLAR